VMVNLPGEHGTFLGLMSGRVASVTAVVVGLYFLYLRLARSEEDTPIGVKEGEFGSGASYLASTLLALLFVFELHPHEWLALAWAAMMLGLMAVALLMRDRQFLLQGLVMALASMVAVAVICFPAHGTLSARVSTLAALGSLFAARVLWQFGVIRGRDRFLPPGRGSFLFEPALRHACAVPAAALLFIYVPLECRGDLARYFTIAWAAEGLLLMVLGFGLADRILRFAGIGVLAAAVIKVFSDLMLSTQPRTYKVIALIGLGAILVLTGLIYARFSDQIKKIFKED